MQGILYKQARIDFLVGQIIEQNYYQKQAGMFSSAIGGARKALSVTAAKVGEIRNSVTAGVNKALFAKGEPTREVFKMGKRRTVGGGIARENLPRTVTPTPTNSPAMFQAAQPRADFNVNSYKQDARARIASKNTKFDVNSYKQEAKARLAARAPEDHNTFEKVRTRGFIERENNQMKGRRVQDIKNTIMDSNHASDRRGAVRAKMFDMSSKIGDPFERGMATQRSGDINEFSRGTSALRSAGSDSIKRRSLLDSFR